MHAVIPDLREYVESEIIPLYDAFDLAHRREHVEMVIRQSLQLAQRLGADLNMAYVIAAFHDTMRFRLPSSVLTMYFRAGSRLIRLS